MEDKQFKQIYDKLAQMALTTANNSQILSILRDMQKWIRFIGWSNVKDVLINCLDTETRLLIYHLSDGTKGIRDIRDEIKKYGLKSSYGGVHGSWQRWKKVGIVEPSHKHKGRFQKVFNLDDFGIAIPKLKEKAVEKEEDEEKEEREEVSET